MTEMALTPAAFNTELRRWVKNVTGKSIGEVGGVARSTAYRQTQGDKLLSLEELLRIVELCVPRNLDPGQRDVFVRQNTTLWRRRWEIAYAARTGTAPEPVASPDVPGPRSPVTGSIAITGAIPVVGGVPRLRFPRARVARLFDTELAHGSWPLADLLQEWGAQERSNLFFISGSSGSGKSTEAQLWAAGQRDAAYVRLLEGPVDFVRLAEEGSERQVVVIDDFDLVSSLAEAPGARPDLSELRGFFARGGRCVVLSKRNLQTDSDELAEQLRSTSRLHDLGVVEPVSVRVLPVSADELDELAAKRDDARLADLATVLGGSRGRMLATPLVLGQLYDTAEEDEPDPRTVWDSYTVYLRHVCGQAWDRRTSRIPGSVRFRIYRDLAWDIFLGRDRRVARRRLAISLDRVRARVVEHMSNERAADAERASELASDLLDLTEIFKVASRATDTTQLAEFAHSTYYEYFVAEAIRAKLCNEQPLELDVGRFDEATMDTLVVDFLKAGLRPDDFDAVAELCGPNAPAELTWLDRVICLFLTEDHPAYGELLDAAPDDYWANLEAVPQRFRSLFVRKVTMYQRVVSGRLDADAYIRLLNDDEDDESRSFERGRLGLRGDVTPALVTRLRNPLLRNAVPITLHRLGQMGDIRFLDDLERYGAEHPEHRELVASAVAAMRERYGGAG